MRNKRDKTGTSSKSGCYSSVLSCAAHPPSLDWMIPKSTGARNEITIYFSIAVVNRRGMLYGARLGGFVLFHNRHCRWAPRRAVSNREPSRDRDRDRRRL